MHFKAKWRKRKNHSQDTKKNILWKREKASVINWRKKARRWKRCFWKIEKWSNSFESNASNSERRRKSSNWPSTMNKPNSKSECANCNPRLSPNPLSLPLWSLNSPPFRKEKSRLSASPSIQAEPRRARAAFSVFCRAIGDAPSARRHHKRPLALRSSSLLSVFALDRSEIARRAAFCAASRSDFVDQPNPQPSFSRDHSLHIHSSRSNPHWSSFT